MTPPLPRLITISLLAIAAAGCRDFEQIAREKGRSARASVAAACGSAAAPTACSVEKCAASCAGPGTGGPRFDRICADMCEGTGLCVRDDDCAPGLRCEALAPVVRRCAPAPPDPGDAGDR